MPLYSYSRIGCFEQCPRKYKFRYIEKPDIEIPQGIEAYMGTIVHESLEQCYRLAQWDKIMSRDELLAYYRRRWEDARPAELKIVRAEMTEEDYMHRGEKALERYYDRHHPFDQEITLGLEEKIIFALDPDGKCKMQGYIDRLSRDGQGCLRIHDYKTSARPKTQIEADHDDQLALYQVAVQDMWPDNNGIELVWHYVQFDTTLVSHREPEQLETLRQAYLDKIRKIERAEELGNFPTIETNLCDWCEYFKLCPAKGGPGVVVEVPDTSPVSLTKNESTRLVDEYIALGKQIKDLDGRQKEIRSILVRSVEPGTGSLLAGSGAEGLMVTLQRIAKLPTASSDPKAVDKIREIVEEAGLWPRFASLNLSQLEKALTEGDLPEVVIEKLTAFQKEQTRDSVRVKKL
jgi:putative RecB family exonuclease